MQVRPHCVAQADLKLTMFSLELGVLPQLLKSAGTTNVTTTLGSVYVSWDLQCSFFAEEKFDCTKAPRCVLCRPDAVRETVSSNSRFLASLLPCQLWDHWSERFGGSEDSLNH